MSVDTRDLRKWSITVNKQPEFEAQKMVIQWARLSQRRYPELALLYCNLNGVKMSIKQAVRAKQAGMVAGIPDLHLPVAMGSYHSLYVEMKAPKGRVSEAQNIVAKTLQKYGHNVVVCYSGIDAIDAIDEILKYLNAVEINVFVDDRA